MAQCHPSAAARCVCLLTAKVMGRGGILTISGQRMVAYSARLHSGLQPNSDIGRSLGEVEGE